MNFNSNFDRSYLIFFKSNESQKNFLVSIIIKLRVERRTVELNDAVLGRVICELFRITCELSTNAGCTLRKSSWVCLAARLSNNICSGTVVWLGAAS